jgi:acyl-CoA reductase-like NAD-dependent aldehyde dehydrogenase
MPPVIAKDPDSAFTCSQEEIFGPILPFYTFDTPTDALEHIQGHSHPLAIYYFGKKGSLLKELSRKTRSGAVVQNEVVFHLGTENLPFGGIGHSGMGQYHGKAGFDTFSYPRVHMKKIAFLDLPFRYAPFGKKLNWLKKLI